MTYEAAIKLVGVRVERKTAKPLIVSDITTERDGSHNVVLSYGQVLPLADFEEMYRVIGQVNNAAV